MKGSAVHTGGENAMGENYSCCDATEVSGLTKGMNYVHVMISLLPC